MKSTNRTLPFKSYMDMADYLDNNTKDIIRDVYKHEGEWHVSIIENGILEMEEIERSQGCA